MTEQSAALKATQEAAEVIRKSMQEEIDQLRAENKRLQEAVAFARSVIKSGEPWTKECERILRS